MEPPGDETLDQALVVRFPAPHSFTGENQLEIHCHGAPVVIARILTHITHLGVRPALPGEFSRRAFQNGKMDLTRAEALMSLIHATTLRAAKEAARQMAGSLASTLLQARDNLLNVLAHLEASLDFSDAEIDPDDDARLFKKITTTRATLATLLAGATLGRHLQEGFELAIIGRPNVGKSSLFNALCGREQAIVTEIPGTTRDLLENRVEIAGIPVLLIDTAGLRQTDEIIEKTGIQRAEDRLQQADGVLWVIEAHRPLNAEDHRIDHLTRRQNRIVVWNKSDLLPTTALLPSLPPHSNPTVALSCHTGIGLEQLTRTIAALFSQMPGEGEGAVVMVTRQREALQRAVAALTECQRLLATPNPGEITAIPLRDALGALGELVGEVSHEQLLDRIFSTFCIGK